MKKKIIYVIFFNNQENIKELSAPFKIEKL